MVRDANVAVVYPEFTDTIEIEFDDELCGVPAWECAHPFFLLDKTVPANVLLPDIPLTARTLPTWLARLLKDYECWTLDSKATVRLVLALITIVLFIAAMWA